MDNSTLDDDLTKKNLSQILSAIKKAGYRNSFKHQKGYIISNKTSLVKVRVVLDKEGKAVVTTIPLGAKEVLINIVILIVFTFLGGPFLFLALAFILISTIVFLISLPKSRAFKTEIEQIIGAS